MKNQTSQRESLNVCRAIALNLSLTQNQSKSFYLASIADSFENG